MPFTMPRAAPGGPSVGVRPVSEQAGGSAMMPFIGSNVACAHVCVHVCMCVCMCVSIYCGVCVCVRCVYMRARLCMVCLHVLRDCVCVSVVQVNRRAHRGVCVCVCEGVMSYECGAGKRAGTQVCEGVHEGTYVCGYACACV